MVYFTSAEVKNLRMWDTWDAHQEQNINIALWTFLSYMWIIRRSVVIYGFSVTCAEWCCYCLYVSWHHICIVTSSVYSLFNVTVSDPVYMIGWWWTVIWKGVCGSGRSLLQSPGPAFFKELRKITKLSGQTMPLPKFEPSTSRIEVRSLTAGTSLFCLCSKFKTV